MATASCHIRSSLSTVRLSFVLMLCHDITEYRNSCICRISENTRWHLRPLVLLSVACPSSLNMSGPFSHTRSNGAGGNPLRNPLFASRRASAHTHALESYRRAAKMPKRKTVKQKTVKQKTRNSFQQSFTALESFAFPGGITLMYRKRTGKKEEKMYRVGSSFVSMWAAHMLSFPEFKRSIYQIRIFRPSVCFSFFSFCC